ncbi:hypothetical protein ABW21_db0209259 [Orbilia brochopaga]|nr:hypothetical protein ABW21_db0209259 [Drechslerella brochopaga]
MSHLEPELTAARELSDEEIGNIAMNAIRRRDVWLQLWQAAVDPGDVAAINSNEPPFLFRMRSLHKPPGIVPGPRKLTRSEKWSLEKEITDTLATEAWKLAACMTWLWSPANQHSTMVPSYIIDMIMRLLLDAGTKTGCALWQYVHILNDGAEGRLSPHFDNFDLNTEHEQWDIYFQEPLKDEEAFM